MTRTELQSHPVVAKLTEIQETLRLKDIPFADQLRLGIHGANWGKIKAATYTGNPQTALLKITSALDDHQKNQGEGIVENGTVILDNVEAALDAMEIAMAADDEHRLVVYSGGQGSGKTRSIQLIVARFGGVYMSALPSWSGSYLTFLSGFAAALGLERSRSAGDAETLILDHLKATPRAVLGIDEFNHFSADGINFIKAILNLTQWSVMIGTIPHHLARMHSGRSTAQESVQLLRRAVAIIHSGTVSTRSVEMLQRALWPHLIEFTRDHANAIAVCANQLHRIDTVTQILEDADSPADIPAAIERHKRGNQITLKPSSAA